MPAMLVRSRSGHGPMRTPSETDRNGSEAAHVARVHVAELVLVHAVDREAAVPLLERDARLEARERRAQAQVAPVAQRELALRSEEHTSELQSLRHLVCRLLLEK